MAGRRKSVNYLNNENLLREIRLSKEKYRTSKVPITSAEALTPALVNMLQLLVHGVSQKYNWRSYSYLSDMKGDALYTLCQNALKFNEEKTQNPFSYYTQIVWSCFVSALDKERKVARIRDALLEEQEMAPSFRRQAENSDEQREPIVRDITVKKTAEDEQKEKLLKQDITFIDETITFIKPDDFDRVFILERMRTIFGPTTSEDIFTSKTMAKTLLPAGTNIEVDMTPDPSYGIGAALRIKRPDGATVFRGIGTLVDGKPVFKRSLNELVALHLCRLALLMHKDTVTKATLIPKPSEKITGKGNGYAAPNRSKAYPDEEIMVAKIDKRRKKA